ncbi:tyrosine-type recombinase/integrase [Pseudomonas sp. xss_1]|uniref:tyrosine-type recombinase/integrase n=1 Tax=Pseudomonas sp. xss_1 TaxID=3367214 RepID=UPI003709D019
MEREPQPLFGTYRTFLTDDPAEQSIIRSVVITYIESFPSALQALNAYEVVVGFLRAYAANEATFNSYRTHAERLCLWALIIRNTPLLHMRRSDAEAYLDFCLDPPATWIGLVVRSRFIADGDGRTINPAWRPFSVKAPKNASGFVAGGSLGYRPSRASISQAFSVCSSLFEYAVDEGLAPVNPFKLIKQKSRFKERHTVAITTRSLTPLQWDFALSCAEAMAAEDQYKHERTLFITATAFSMYLRVSDLCGRVNWKPTMGDFRMDDDGNWWFHVVGKGNKRAKVAVREQYVQRYLTRYRNFLGLPSLPSPHEKTPLLSSLSGRPGLTTRSVRAIVQSVFDRAVDKMIEEGRSSYEIEGLRSASTHWLRHTAATFDAPWRDPKDLQADMRHTNISTTQNTYYSSHDDKRAFSVKKLGLKNRD